jgi:hypothetical protein
LIYSVSLKERRLIRRIAFFFSIRRVSLFETNQRLRRTVLRTPLFTTFLRKRLSKESCDSPFLKFTDATGFTSFQDENKKSTDTDSADRDYQNLKRTHDHSIKKPLLSLIDT